MCVYIYSSFSSLPLIKGLFLFHSIYINEYALIINNIQIIIVFVKNQSNDVRQHESDFYSYKLANNNSWNW